MRTACVEKVRGRGRHIESTANHLPSGDRTRELHAQARMLYKLASDLESLTLDQVEQEKR